MVAYVPVEDRLSVLLAEHKSRGRIMIMESDLPAGWSKDFRGMTYGEAIEVRAINGILYGKVWDCDYGLLHVKLTEETCKDCGKTVYRMKDNTMTYEEFMDLDEDSYCYLNEEGHEI